ncbi:uncharacterized protein LOC134838503 [Culicoides brevitarsis]|uniref:uncharacterized protein LOC134838503 n=1 Tax=Culicoides brevitarsis TaxID=469753 RepID=UPI00307C6BE2
MVSTEDILEKLEPRCLCCLSEASEKFSAENLTRILQDLVHAELPQLFKYVPTVFCVDCVAALQLYEQFKAKVQRSFVSLEKLVIDRGLNKNDYLEQLEIIPRVSPDPFAEERKPIKLPLKVLWKSPGRPRKDGTAAQPRFFKKEPKSPPVYISDSYKSDNSSEDENYCRRSDNEEWNPDQKNPNLMKREKKYKTKLPGVMMKGGKRGRPRKTTDDNAPKKSKPHTNGIMNNHPTERLEQLNGNHTKNPFAKRPRGRPARASDATSILVKKQILQKSNESNIQESPRILGAKKRRGRPKKTASSPTATLVVTNNKKLKKCTKPSMVIKSLLKKKPGRPRKNSAELAGMEAKNKSSPESEANRKRKRSQLEKSVGWTTETEEESRVIREEYDSDSVMTATTTGTLPAGDVSRSKSYKSFILAS